jgi:hypothetical protein
MLYAAVLAGILCIAVLKTGGKEQSQTQTIVRPDYTDSADNIELEVLAEGEEKLKGLKAELAALDRKIQLELAPPQEQDTAEKHETKNIETEQSIVGKQARSVCRL